MVKLRHQIFHFVSTLQQYVHFQLSHVSWCRFLQSLKHKKDAMEDSFEIAAEKLLHLTKDTIPKHLMLTYTASHPYLAMDPHGGMYAHLLMPTVSLLSLYSLYIRATTFSFFLTKDITKDTDVETHLNHLQCPLQKLL